MPAARRSARRARFRASAHRRSSRRLHDRPHVADARSGSVIAPRWMVAATFLLAAAIVLSWQAMSSTVQPTLTVAWGSVGFAAVRGQPALPGRWRQREMARAGPVVVRILDLALVRRCLRFGPLTWLHPQPGSGPRYHCPACSGRFGSSRWGSRCGYSAISIGPGRSEQAFREKAMAALSHRFTSEVRSPLAPWILYAIGTAARIATAVTTGRFGYVGSNVQSGLTTASGYQQWLPFLGRARRWPWPPRPCRSTGNRNPVPG